MSKHLENPFEYLRRKDGSDFSPETINNWYKARSFVLDRLGDIEFMPDENAHLHVIVQGDSPLMLSIVRQVALSAHYINYDEENKNEEKRNRTVITIVSQKSEDDIIRALKDEACLCNLLDYCKYKLFNAEVINNNSYIDIEVIIVRNQPVVDSSNSNDILIKEDDVISFCNSKMRNDESLTIDTRKAQYADRMYELGTLITNLPAENIHDAHRYTLALDVYQYKKLQESLGNLINDSKWRKDQVIVKNGLSNVFCSDCFETREKEIMKAKNKAIKNSKTKEGKTIIRKENFWEKYNESLSKSEHARWVVEKLIMGFRPLNNKERIEDECLFPNKEKRKSFRDEIKTDEKRLVHINLCSYADLRRVNPENMKYDSFLMLAIPKILEKIRKDDKKVSIF